MNENDVTEDHDEGNQPSARIFNNLFHHPGPIKPFHPPYPIQPFPDGGDFGNPLYPNNFEYLWYLNPGYGEQPVPPNQWYPNLYSNEGEAFKSW